MKKNIKSIVIASLLILFLIIVGLIYSCYTSVEYSMYKVFSNVLSGNAEPDHISTKCKYHSAYSNMNPEDKAMYMYLLGVKELKEENISCHEYLKNDGCMAAHILNGIYTSTNNTKLQQKRLIDFIIKKQANYYDNAYGYSYECKDNDKDEKVCVISDNDDGLENLHFKKVNSQWLLFDIDYSSL